MITVESLLASLGEIENEVLHADSSASDILGSLTTLQADTKAKLNIANDNIDQDILLQVHQATQRIQLIVQARLRLETTFEDLRLSVIKDARCAISSHASERDSQSQDLSESLPSYHMRKHFLATLDDPYPTQNDKDALIAITNETAKTNTPLKMSQLTLWFINARRRSGWSDIMKKFAAGDRTRMKLLVQAKMLACDLPIKNELLPEAKQFDVEHILRETLKRRPTAADLKEFEDDWNSMISWIKYGVKEKVGQWVYDLVAANKKSPVKSGQQRTVTTAAKRTPARKPRATKPRVAKQRPSKTSSTSSDIVSGLDSTPELSMCSTADTSFSSISSNFSMPQYDPFQRGDQLLTSPTLNAAAGRKVRALPKRVFKLNKESLYTDQGTQSLNGTCGELVPGEQTHTLVPAGQTGPFGGGAFPPYDALGQAPMPIVRRRESLSSNSLSAAFG